MRRLESLLKIAVIKFEFLNLEIRFRKRQVSFLVVKTVKCKRGISLTRFTTAKRNTVSQKYLRELASICCWRPFLSEQEHY